MSLSIGIVGLPNVGKSTLFQAITKKQVDASNYPFCTIEPNVGVVTVPDERVDKLVKLSNSVKKVYATVQFVDIAGLVKGASKGEGLGNKFLANIREMDAIVYVLRSFGGEKVVNTREDVDPLSEKEILDTELMLKDLEVVEKRIKGLEKDIRAKNKEAEKEHNILVKARVFLEKGEGLVLADFNEEEKDILQNYQLLTMKPRLYLLNAQNEDIAAIDIFRKNNWPFLVVDILEELGAVDLNSEERVSLGLSSESKLNILIEKSYELLGLINFLTTGADETRSWMIKEGSIAPKAAGVIHGDFEKNFIKAEVVNWQDLINAGGFSEARAKGLIRSEGKEYIIKDGDVIEIKHGA